jgi:tetratricopeptide (TPR) repeat protein
LVLNNYAYFLSLTGEDETTLNRALAMSSQAIALDKNNSSNLDTHAWILFKLGRAEEAQTYMRQALSLDNRKSPELNLHYGDILYALGKEFLAKTYWRKALEFGADPKEIEERINKLK